MTSSDLNASGEIREDVPLKKTTKQSKCFLFNEETIGGSKFINISFAILTITITLFLLLQIYYGDYQIIPQGSVASDGKECSEIGTSILKIGGNAIDATIATAFCLTVVCPHITGLDSSGQVIIHDHRRRENTMVVDFRHVESVDQNLRKLVVALIFLHKHYGSLEWKDLVKPAADLAKKGFLVSKMLEQAIRNTKPQYFNVNIVAGQIIKLENLGETLYDIQGMPIDDVYNSIPEQNLPKVNEALNFTFNNYNIFIPDTEIGYVLGNILHQLETTNITNDRDNNLDTAYLRDLINIIRKEMLKVIESDELLVGTSSNMAVMDTNDLYVSFVSGMHSFFGTRNFSKGGFFIDDNIRNTSNYMPFIITDKFTCGRRIASGSNDVITASQVISSLLFAIKNITSSIESPRFNIINGHLVFEDHEPLFSNEVFRVLDKLDEYVQPLSAPYFSCNIVEKIKDDLSSHSDSRGGGISSRF